MSSCFIHFIETRLQAGGTGSPEARAVLTAFLPRMKTVETVSAFACSCTGLKPGVTEIPMDFVMP
jgi:hypothetical protein